MTIRDIFSLESEEFTLRKAAYLLTEIPMYYFDEVEIDDIKKNQGSVEVDEFLKRKEVFNFMRKKLRKYMLEKERYTYKDDHKKLRVWGKITYEEMKDFCKTYSVKCPAVSEKENISSMLPSVRTLALMLAAEYNKRDLDWNSKDATSKIKIVIDKLGRDRGGTLRLDEKTIRMALKSLDDQLEKKLILN